MKSLKKKLRNKEITVGSWIALDHPAIVEIMVNAGFDWLVVDMEHSDIGIKQAQQLIQIIDLAGCVPLVRLSENDPTLIKRVMDAGAQGIIVPMVNTKEDALKAVNAIKYPPEGIRGVGLARAQGYGSNFDTYFNSINSESIVIVQIEHKEAVENISEIVKVKGVDGVIIGPYDMSASYGIPGKLNHNIIRRAEKSIRDAVDKQKIALGTHAVWPMLENVEKNIKEGFTFIAYSTDMIMLQYHFSNDVKKIKEILKKQG